MIPSQPAVLRPMFVQLPDGLPLELTARTEHPHTDDASPDYAAKAKT